MYDEVVPLNPCDYSVIDGQVILKASARTNFFRKRGVTVRDNAAFCCVKRSGDCTLSARVSVGGKSPYDAVFLMVRQDEKRWVQLGLERTLGGQFRLISRRTNGWTEDSSNRVHVDNGCYLRIVRRGDTFLTAVSPDSVNWMAVDSFEMAMNEQIALGFGGQSPQGDGCEVKVGDITLANVAMPSYLEQD